MSVISYGARRAVECLLTLLTGSFAVYAALYLAPGSPLGFLLGHRSVSPEDAAVLRRQYQLDQPFLARYWHWLAGILGGHLGTSVISRQPVTAVIGARLTTSAALVAFAALLLVLVAVVTAAVSFTRSRLLDHTVVVGTTLGMAVPSFVTATVLTTFLAVQSGLFPVQGDGSGLIDRIWHLSLPAVTLAAAAGAFMTRVTRTAVRTERDAPYVEALLSRGVPPRQLFVRHVVRGSAPAIISALGLTVGGLLVGAVIIEQAFGLDGIGSLLVSSIQTHDFPVVQPICLIVLAVFVITSGLADILARTLDPRLARQAGGA